MFLLVFFFKASLKLLNIFRQYFTLQNNLTGLTRNELSDLTGCNPPCSYYEYTEVAREKVDYGGLGELKSKHDGRW